MACIAQQARDFRAAIAGFTLIPATGTSAPRRCSGAVVLAQTEQWDEAEMILRQAAGLSINHLVQTDAEYFLGYVYRATDREDAAMRQFQWVYGQNPTTAR